MQIIYRGINSGTNTEKKINTEEYIDISIKNKNYYLKNIILLICSQN